MRILLNAELDTTAANRAISEGRLAEINEQLLDNLRPEAAYFYARNGRRALTLVVDLPDPSSLPRIAEPLWQELDAHVEVVPCMTADELRGALADLG